MNRASLVYLVVFSVFAIGIWVILDLGTSLLTAPRDLAGRWALVGAPAKQAEAFSIDQSGRYLRFTFENDGPSFDAVLRQNSPQAEGTASQNLIFDGGGWHVVGTGNGRTNDVKFSFRPPAGVQTPPAGTYRRERIIPANSTPSAAH
jgi:hypothetical protein